MKYLLIILFFAISNSAMANYSILPGENKTVTLKTFGAATASAVSVRGIDGVTASVNKIVNPNEIEINLSARRNAWGGKGELRVTLTGGVHKKRLYVYSMPRITIDSPREAISGQNVKVKLAWVHPDSGLIALSRRGQGHRPIQMTKTGNARYEFDVKTTDNDSYTRYIVLQEREQIREFPIRYSRDNRVPNDLMAPTYPSSEKDKHLSSRNPYRNVTVKWNTRQGANAYLVSYKKPGQNRFTEFQVNNTTTAVLRNIPVGETKWKVKAVYDPALTGSTLNKVISPPSKPVSVFVTQNSVENKLKHRKRGS